MYESGESSSPIITRAVSGVLQNRRSEIYEFSGFQRSMLRLLGGLPQDVSRWLIPRVQSPTTLDAAQLMNFDLNALLDLRLADYQGIPAQQDSILMGVGMGGTTGHLASALRAPFLPQTFVMSLKNGSLDGNVHRYQQYSAGLARKITDQYPELVSIQHYDPVHDGWLTRWVNHLRLKLVQLPDRYKAFIRSHLKPGGEVVMLEGRATWLRYRTGERNYFQVGGWGDISAEEFLSGSDRIRKVCNEAGVVDTCWKLDEYPLERGPESEWGSEAGFSESVEAFCRAEGYSFRKIAFDDPNDFNRLAFHAFEALLRKEGREPAGVVVEMFTQFDLMSVLEAGLLPLWLIFNTMDSLRFLESMTPLFPGGKPVFFSPLSTFSLTPDMVPWEEWERALGGFAWTNIGARKTHYPADPRALIEWNRPLIEWAAQNRQPIQQRLTGEELTQIAGRVHHPQG